PWREHAPLYRDLFADPAVAAALWPGAGRGPRSIRQALSILAEDIAHWQREAFGPWVFFEAASGLFVGRGGAGRPPGTGLGWRAGPLGRAMRRLGRGVRERDGGGRRRIRPPPRDRRGGGLRRDQQRRLAASAGEGRHALQRDLQARGPAPPARPAGAPHRGLTS